jgi:putative addiction module killer protein
MIEVRQTAAFSGWLHKLRDQRAKAHIVARIRRASFGNLGDVRPVGAGISEMRIDHGARATASIFVGRGDKLIVLLCGGDKSTQDGDIRKAKAIARELKET